MKKWQYTNLVPPLSSPSQNGYKVSASSIYSSQTADDVVLCFDGNTNNVVPGEADWTKKIFLSASNTDQTITIELPSAKELRMVAGVFAQPAYYGVSIPKSIAVSGSNDGTYYTPLTGASVPYCLFVRDVSETTPYKYYKVSLVRSSEFIGLIELILLGK